MLLGKIKDQLFNQEKKDDAEEKKDDKLEKAQQFLISKGAEI